MIPNFIYGNKKYLLLAALLVLFAAAGIIHPLYTKYTKDNWDVILNEKVASDEALINKILSSKTNRLVSETEKIKLTLQIALQQKEFSGSEINGLLNNDYQFTVQLIDENSNLIFWNKNNIAGSINESAFLENIGQVIFKTEKLTTCLSLIDIIDFSNKKYFLFIGLPLETRLKSYGEGVKTLSLTDSLSRLINTSVQINYNPGAELSKDGRIHSFLLLNNYRNKIGTVEIEKPAFDNEQQVINNIFDAVQASIALMVYLVICWIIFPKLKNITSRLLKFISLVIFTSTLRLLLFFTGIPSSYVNNSLTDSVNFSSTFAFGMVRSPLELFISALFGLAIFFVGFRYVLDYYDSEQQKNKDWKKFYGLAVIIFFFFLLILRGLGASLRSVVFDSSIRYFKEFNLIPDAPTFLMNLNILILGFSVILISLSLFVILFSLKPVESRNASVKLFLILFVLLQILASIFDILQKQPQGTPLIRIVFVTIVFVLLYLLVFKDYRSITKYLYIAFGASIATVSLLTYYNSEIERESLKTTALELTRSDESIYRFMVYQTLVNIQNDNDVKQAYLENRNLYSAAYLVWAKSLLYRETVPVVISFYNSEGELKGKFSNSVKSSPAELLGKTEQFNEDINISVIQDIYGSEKSIGGFVKIWDNNNLLGVVEVRVINSDGFPGFESIPKILTARRTGVSSAVDLEKLKIYYFKNGKLERFYGAAALSEADSKKIFETNQSREKEAWLSTVLNGEKHLFYIFKIENANDSFLAVGKEEKNISWNLSDFFKVFFIHTLLIITIALVIALWNYKRLFVFIQSYRTKLAFAFFMVALVPLFIIAVYFRTITENKNRELTNNRLFEMAEQTANYLKKYSALSTVNPELYYKKASDELDIHFSVFRNNSLEYSTSENFYNSGLMQSLIPFQVYLDCSLHGIDRSISYGNFQNHIYSSVFVKDKLNGEARIIEVNNLFNKIDIPLSDVEFDIFMFGVFSLVVIVLIILSSVIAGQISYPIRKLTHATRSVGGGDLDVEVKGEFSGEIGELASGFNMMVKKLRKSQVELAQLERETAWKEMAKQVAHEIKNPLTPMKLSVQQLIASYKDKSPKFDDIFEKVTSTIIAQVEILRNIASEFSNFARMPKLNIERIDIIPVIRDAINLFGDEKLSIKFKHEQEQVNVFSDVDHLNRTFINLIRNSIQASAKNIFINLSLEENNCLIRIIDDGTGIPFENKEKIFEENFTTKTTGMGLGLSMAKKFIENINGSIIVESTPESGAAFLITIPLSE